MPLMPPPGPTEETDDNPLASMNREQQAFFRQAVAHINNTGLSQDKKKAAFKATLNSKLDPQGYDKALQGIGVDGTHRQLLTTLRTKGPAPTIAPQPGLFDTLKGAEPAAVQVVAGAPGAIADAMSQSVTDYRQKKAAENLPPAAHVGRMPPPAPLAPGQVEAGNISNLFDRPTLKNTDPNDPFNPVGSYSTTSSASFTDERSGSPTFGREVLIPTVVDGKRLSSVETGPDGKPRLNIEAAKQHYYQTGQHLGVFDTPENADAYATQLHLAQASTTDPEAPGFPSSQMKQPLLERPPIKPATIAPEPGIIDTLKGIPQALKSMGLWPSPGEQVTPVTPAADFGSLAKMAAGVMSGAQALITGGGALGRYDPETGTVTVPGGEDPEARRARASAALIGLNMPKPTAMTAPIHEPLAKILTEGWGVPSDIANFGAADEIGAFVGAALPWSQISRGITSIVDAAPELLRFRAASKVAESAGLDSSALSSSLAEKIQPVRRVVDIAQDILKRAGIQAVTGATFAQLEQAPPDESLAERAKRTGQTALWAAGLSTIVDGLLSIPEATRSARFAALKPVKDALTDLLYRDGKTSAEAATKAADEIIDKAINANGGVPRIGWSKQIANQLRQAAERAKRVPPTEPPLVEAPEGQPPTVNGPPPEEGQVSGPGFTMRPAPPSTETAEFPEGAPKPGEPPAVTTVQGGNVVSTTPMEGKTIEDNKIVDATPFRRSMNIARADYPAFDNIAPEETPLAKNSVAIPENIDRAKRYLAEDKQKYEQLRSEPKSDDYSQESELQRKLFSLHQNIAQYKWLANQAAPTPSTPKRSGRTAPPGAAEAAEETPPAAQTPFRRLVDDEAEQILKMVVDLQQSGDTDLTGKGKRDVSPSGEQGPITSRFGGGGFAKQFPFLKGEGSPSQIAKAILKDGNNPAYVRIKEAVTKWVLEHHGEDIRKHLDNASPAEIDALFPEEAGGSLEFPPSGTRTSDLGQTAEEGLSNVAGGRRPELLKEGKAFDSTRLVDSELFGGKGGPQGNLLETPESGRTPPPAAPKPALDAGLHHALHSMQGAAGRWAERQKTGLSNEDLTQAIAYEFGTQGSSSARGDSPEIAVKGGDAPKFWLGTMNWSGAPTLQGTKLVNEVRRLMNIPQPQEGGAEQGASAKETALIGSALTNAEAGQNNGSGEQVTHVFDPPKKQDIVRLQEKAKAQGFLTPDQAKQRIAEWKQHALAQGKTRANADKVVLSFFDRTGEWSQPWVDAGYQVHRFDIQNDPEFGDVTKFSTEFFNDLFAAFEGHDVHAILAACPCTDFAVSGARHFAAKDADGRTVESVKLVQHTLATIEYFKPSIWALENPVGRIEKLTGLPPWRLSFDPNHFGDPYTKKTLLWGRFNADLPVAPVEPTEGSKMHQQYGGKSLSTKNARSITPEGFAYSFFMANNAIDHPVMTVANKYDRLNKGVVERAVKAGLSEEDISEAVDDPYYIDLDDKKAEAALSEATAAKGKRQPPPGSPASLLDSSVTQARGHYETWQKADAKLEELSNAEGERVVDDRAKKHRENLKAESKRQKDLYETTVAEIEKAFGQKTAEATRQQIEKPEPEEKTPPVSAVGKAHEAGKLGPPPSQEGEQPPPTAVPPPATKPDLRNVAKQALLEKPSADKLAAIKARLQAKNGPVVSEMSSRPSSDVRVNQPAGRQIQMPSDMIGQVYDQIVNGESEGAKALRKAMLDAVETPMGTFFEVSGAAREELESQLKKQLTDWGKRGDAMRIAASRRLLNALRRPLSFTSEMKSVLQKKADEATRLVDQIAARIDSKYEAGKLKGIDKLEAELEKLLDVLEEAGDTEEEDNNGRWDLATVLEETLAREYHELITGRYPKDEVLTRMRENFRMSPSQTGYGIQPGYREDATDDQILAAAKDAYEHRLSLRERLKANPGEIDRIKQWLADRKRALQSSDVSEMQTEGGKAAAGMDPRIIKVLGGNLYKGDIGTIAVKELIQNAVDAVRELPNASDGAITLHVDTVQRTVTISDNGPGMLPAVATRELMDIGGTKKGEGASGGFGIAKVAIFGNADNINISTIAKDPATGKNIKTTLTGSSDDWIDPAKGLTVETRETDEPTGTHMLLKISEEAKFGHYQTERFLKPLLASWRLPYKLNATLDKTPIPGSAGTWQRLTALQVPGATADIYIGDKEEMTRYDSINYSILNNGIYQFSGGVMMPKNMKVPPILVDVHPSDAPESPNYPFEPSREGLRSNELASEIFTFIRENIVSIASQRELKEYQSRLSNAPRTRADIPIVDTAGVLPRELVYRLAESQYMEELSAQAQNMMGLMLEDINLRRGDETIAPPDFGIGLGQSYLGLNILGSALEARRNVLLLNPYVIALEIRTAIERGLLPELGPSMMAEQMAATLIHELSHQRERGHDESFAGELTRNAGHATRASFAAIRAFEQILTADGNAAYNQIHDDLKGLEPHWGGEDIFGKIGAGFAGEGESGGPEGLAQPGEGTGTGSEGTLPAGSEHAPEGLAQGAGVQRSLASLDPETQQDLVTYATAQFEQTPDASQWQNEIVNALGDWVRPYLRETYQLIQSVASSETTPPAIEGGAHGTETATPGGARSPPPAPAGQSASGVGAGPAPRTSPPGEAGAVGGSPEAAGAVRAPSGRTGPPATTQRQPNRGTRVRGTAAGSTRVAPPGAPTPPPAAGPLNKRNYRITPEDQIGSGGPKTKFQNNVTALKILKALDRENRLPTDEERRALAKYVGWGGLSEAAFGYTRDTQALRDELRELLTDEEYSAARASTKNAHFTSEPIVRFIWSLAERMGFKGGTFLETSMGVGNFLGLAPDKISKSTQFTGVELDKVTAAIAKYLYPDAMIFNRGYESVSIPDDSIDFSASNVPFGQYKLHDPRYNKQNALIHDYFFLKTLDKLRPGGVLMFITSKGTMDKTNPRIRQLLADQADLVFAVRFPNTAFAGNAGTEVTTDLIVLRKRLPGEAPAGESWLDTNPNVTISNPSGIRINQYYEKHPNNLLGRMEESGTMYRGGEPQLVPTRPLDQMMTEALAGSPTGIFTKRGQLSRPEIESAASIAPDHVKEGAYVVDDNGKIKQRVDGQLKTPTNEKLHGGPGADRVKQLIPMRDQLKRVLSIQLEGVDDQTLGVEQKRLSGQYDAYVKQHGFLHGAKTSSVFRDDPEYPLLLSLENYNSETRTSTKADIFTVRTIAPLKPLESVSDDPKEALLQILADKGFPDLDRLAELQNRDPEDVARDLEAQNLVFKDPQTGRYIVTEDYLSGNVVEKLDVAEAAAKDDPSFQRNVDALNGVQPARIPIQQVSPKLGATWVQIPALEDWTQQVTGGYTKISYVGGAWGMEGSATPGAQSEYGTPRVPLVEMIQHSLNQTRPTVYDTERDGSRTLNQVATLEAREKQELLKEKFAEWARNHPGWSPKLETIYNRTFNNLKLREYNGAHLTLPGSRIDPDFVPRPHQLNAIWRVVVEGRALLAHVVGAGKSFEVIAAGMELRRLGISKKNLYVVRNGGVEQFREQFMRAYPAANILSVGPDDLTGPRRKKMTARIATGDWDGIIMQQSSFSKVPISPEWQARTLQKELDELEDTLRGLGSAKGGSRMEKKTVKQLEKAKASREAKLKELAEMKRDDTINFDQLGVDMLFVDEAQAYKNLAFFTKMGRIAGLGQGDSKIASDMKAKTDYMLERHKGRGVVFMTGTPITNTMAEIYNMTRFVAPDVLENAGIRYFDDWAANFGSVRDIMELSPDGRTYRARAKFARFQNAPELITMFRSFTDVKHAEELNLPTPKVEGGRPKSVAVPSNEVIEPIFQELVRRGEALRTGHVDPRDDNWLKLTSDGKKVALDARLYDPTLPDHPESKTNVAVNMLAQRWAAGKSLPSTQLVFADNFRHTNRDTGQEEFNLFRDMKAKLVARGIPADEIALVHDWDTETKLPIMQERMKKGQIRILMGTRAKLGVGMNIQDRLKTLYDMDEPWRPADIEQGHGRIVRQGNLHYDLGQDVELIQLITEGSFDAYIFQALETKAMFIHQVMSGNLSNREIEDLASEVVMNFATQKAIASGNPDVKRKVDLEAEIQRVGMLERAFRDEQKDRQWKISRFHSDIADNDASLARLREAQEQYLSAGGPATFSANVLGETFAERKDLVEFIEKNFERVFSNDQQLVIRGVPVTMRVGANGWTLQKGRKLESFYNEASVEKALAGGWTLHDTSYFYTYTLFNERTSLSTDDKGLPSPEGFVSSVDYHLRKLGENIANLEHRNAIRSNDIAELQHLLATATFRDADKMAGLRQELTEVNERLKEAKVDVSNTPDEEVADTVDDGGDEKDGAGENPASALLSGRSGKLPNALQPPPGPEDVEADAKQRISEAIGDVPPPIPGSGRVAWRRQPPPGGGTPVFESTDPEVQERVMAAAGNSESTPITERAKGALDEMVRKLTRKYPELPHNARFGPVADKLTMLDHQFNVARDRAVYRIYDYILGLTPDQRTNLRWKILLDDMRETYGNVEADTPLPFGYTRAVMETDGARIDQAVSGDPALDQAAARRKQHWDQVRSKYIDAMDDIGFNVEKRLNRESYMRHRVMEYAQGKADSQRRASAAVSNVRKRSFLRARKVHAKDFSTNYLEADFEVMAQVMFDTEIAKFMKWLGDKYDVRDDLRKQAIGLNEEATLAALTEIEGDPEGAEAAMRKMGRKQAEAFERLGALAFDQQLPDNNGRFDDVVEILSNNYQKNLEVKDDLQEEWTPADRIPFKEAEIKRVMAYASWLAQQPEEASIPAKMLFKGVQEKKQRMKELIGADFKTWDDLIPDGYAIYPSRPDKTFFTATTIPESIAAEVMEQAMGDQIGIEPKDLRRVLAVGGATRTMVIPTQIADTLDNLRPPRPVGDIGKIAESAVSMWKQWTLMSPMRAIGYNLRNFSEIDKVFAMNPGALKKAPQSIRELYPVVIGKKPATGALEAWYNRGGLQSVLKVQEIGDINKLKLLESLVESDVGSNGKITGQLAKLWEGYWEAVNDWTSFREAILRYANFLQYREQMNRSSDGRPDNFGASIPEEVMALTDIDDRAWKLSDELMGAYDKVSWAGQQIRKKLAPFWSFQETNLKAWTRGMLNAAQDRRFATQVGRRVLGAAAFRAPYMAWRVGKFWIKALALFAGALYLWNNSPWMIDDEQDVPEFDRIRPHVTLGRYPDGHVLYFGRLGTMNDFLEWFGADETPVYMRDLLNGLMAPADVVYGMAFKSPLTKGLSQLAPWFKVPLELISGVSLFPDPMNPRPIYDRWLSFFSNFGLQNMYRAAAGIPGDRGTLTTEFTGARVAPAYEADYDTVRNMKFKYMQLIGKGNDGGGRLNVRGEALRNYKLAMRDQDQATGQKYLGEYFALGGTDLGLNRSLRTLDPLFGLTDDEKGDFMSKLSKEDQAKVVRAYTFYQILAPGIGPQ